MTSVEHRKNDFEQTLVEESVSRNVRSEDDSYRSHKHPQKVLDRINCLRMSQKLCDVTIKVEEEEFRVHRVVLAANTQYFEAMFSSDLEESRQDVVTIRDVSPSAMKTILEYCYTSAISIDNDNVELLSAAACLLQISEVTNACCEYMKKRLDMENCLSVRSFAEAHNFEDLAKEADHFAQQHYSEVIKGEEFLQLSHKELACLLESDELNVQNEEMVFESVINWARYDIESRKASLALVLQHVRLPLLSPNYLVSKVSSEPLIRADQACRDLVDEAKDYLLLPDQRSKLQGPRTQPRRLGQGCEVLYAVGGWCSGEAMSMVERYDCHSNEWKMVATMSKRRCGVGVAVVNDFLFAIGGHDGSQYLCSVERYNPKTNQWSSTISPMSICRTSFGTAVLDNFIYVVGGQDGLSCLASVEKYNPVDNTWKGVAPMLSRRLGVAVSVIGGRLYAVGGSDGVRPLNTVERYDPRKDSWELVCPMLNKRKHLGLATLNNKLYAVGGRDNSAELDTVEQYDPITDRWTPSVAMTTRRSGVGLALVNDHLYAVGGFDGTTYLKEVEMFDQLANQWKAAGRMKYRRLGGGVGVLPAFGNTCI